MVDVAFQKKWLLELPLSGAESCLPDPKHPMAEEAKDSALEARLEMGHEA